MRVLVTREDCRFCQVDMWASFDNIDMSLPCTRVASSMTSPSTLVCMLIAEPNKQGSGSFATGAAGVANAGKCPSISQHLDLQRK